MTRRRDLICEDILGCDHAPETLVQEDGEIVAWLCRCGLRYPVKVESKEVDRERT